MTLPLLNELNDIERAGRKSVRYIPSLTLRATIRYCNPKTATREVFTWPEK